LLDTTTVPQQTEITRFIFGQPLKPFSIKGEGRAINLYNIDRCIGIENAPIRGQCAHSYFYGKDLRLEKLLKLWEDAYANAARNITEPGYALTDADRSVLRRFCYLQHCRTEATSQRAATSMSEIADIGWNGEAPADWRTTMRDAVLMGMRAFSNTMHIVDDLKVCLVRNTTNQPFVTSDDPAVITNRWYAQSPSAKGLSGGMGSAGALLFLPVTPTVMAVIYDGDVYSIPNTGGWTTSHKNGDIEAFNEHQFLSCLANVYFADWKTLARVNQAFETVRPYRPANRHEILTATLEHADNWGERYRGVAREELERQGRILLHMRTIQPRPARWPSIIKRRFSPRIYSNGTATGFVRRSTAEENSHLGRPYERVT
jgi:hypothetical protein